MTVHPYTLMSDPSYTLLSRSLHGPEEGTLLLSLEGDQNPDADGSATNFQAQVIALPSGRFSLYWTDQMINDWSEEYADLSVAMLRLAAIIRCYEQDFHIGFVSGDVATFEREQASRAFAQIVR